MKTDYPHSYWGIIAALPLLIVLLFRIFDEERYLRDHLPGYTEYCRKFKSRLIPFVF